MHNYIFSHFKKCSLNHSNKQIFCIMSTLKFKVKYLLSQQFLNYNFYTILKKQYLKATTKWALDITS